MTTYVQITNGTVGVIAPAPTQPGYGPDGHWHDYTDPAEVSAYLATGGWLPVVETPRPADTATHTHHAVYTLNGQTVTQTWQQVAKSAEQVAARHPGRGELLIDRDLAAQVVDALGARIGGAR